MHQIWRLSRLLQRDKSANFTSWNLQYVIYIFSEILYDIFLQDLQAACKIGPFEDLPQLLMFSEETLPQPPVFYYGFPVSEQWIIDLGNKEKLDIWWPQEIDTSETRELSSYHVRTLIPEFLQKKTGIKSFTLLLRKIHTYVDGGNGYIITIRTNYFYKHGLVPTDDDVNKLRVILGKDENEKPKWYIGSLLREIQWCLGNGRGKVYPKSYLDYP